MSTWSVLFICVSSVFSITVICKTILVCKGLAFHKGK